MKRLYSLATYDKRTKDPDINTGWTLPLCEYCATLQEQKLKNALQVKVVGFDFMIYYFSLAFTSTSISYVAVVSIIFDNKLF